MTERRSMQSLVSLTNRSSAKPSKPEDAGERRIATASVEGVKLANLPNGRHNSPDKRTTIQVPTIKSDSIAVESVLGESETLLIFSPKPYDHELAEEIVERGYGMGQVLMIRTQLISDSEFLKSFVPE